MEAGCARAPYVQNAEIIIAANSVDGPRGGACISNL
jgi:hypothetical protein